MRLQRLLWLLPLLFGPAAHADDRLGLGDGEVLTYNVSWVVLPGVGSIEIAAHAAIDPATGAPQMRVDTTTSTSGLAYLLLPFEARSESLYDANTGRLLSLDESSLTRAKSNIHRVTFDYAAGIAHYITPPPDGANRLLPMPPGYPTDLITCLLNARTWNLKPGQTRDALVLFNDEFFELTIHAIRYEDQDTPLGRFHALALEPRMEKTPPKGMFKRGSTARVWISQDDRHLPVRFQVEFKFGTGVATLTDYRPPTQPQAYRGYGLP
jgi:hypothetical protein